MPTNTNAKLTPTIPAQQKDETSYFSLGDVTLATAAAAGAILCGATAGLFFNGSSCHFTESIDASAAGISTDDSLMGGAMGVVEYHEDKGIIDNACVTGESDFDANFSPVKHIVSWVKGTKHLFPKDQESHHDQVHLVGHRSHSSHHEKTWSKKHSKSVLPTDHTKGEVQLLKFRKLQDWEIEGKRGPPKPRRTFRHNLRPAAETKIDEIPASPHKTVSHTSHSSTQSLEESPIVVHTGKGPSRDTTENKVDEIPASPHKTVSKLLHLSAAAAEEGPIVVHKGKSAASHATENRVDQIKVPPVKTISLESSQGSQSSAPLPEEGPVLVFKGTSASMTKVTKRSQHGDDDSDLSAHRPRPAPRRTKSKHSLKLTPRHKTEKDHKESDAEELSADESSTKTHSGHDDDSTPSGSVVSHFRRSLRGTSKTPTPTTSPESLPFPSEKQQSESTPPTTAPRKRHSAPEVTSTSELQQSEKTTTPISSPPKKNSTPEVNSTSSELGMRKTSTERRGSLNSKVVFKKHKRGGSFQGNLSEGITAFFTHYSDKFQPVPVYEATGQGRPDLATKNGSIYLSIVGPPQAK